MRALTTMGELCTLLHELIPWLEGQPPGRMFDVEMFDGTVHRISVNGVLTADEIRDVRSGDWTCPEDSAEPIRMMEPGADGDVLVRVILTVEDARQRDRMTKLALGIGAAVVGVGLLYWMAKKSEDRSMGTLELPQVGPGQCCPPGARVTKNQRCHDGRKFVAFVPCARRLPPPRMVPRQPYPPARW